MKLKTIVQFFIIFIFLFPAVSEAQESINLHLYGRAFIGEASDLVVVPPIAYVATPTGLLTVDVSSPDTILPVVHQYIDLPSDIFGGANISLADDVLFFGYGGTLLAYDVTTPLQPLKIAHHQFPAATLGDIVVNGEYLYIGDGRKDSVRIVEFTTDSKFNIIGGFSTGDVRGLFLDGDRLYVAIGFGGQLRIYNVADPSRPYYIGGYDGLDIGNNVHVRDGIAYFANGTEGLIILDVNVPSNVQKLGAYNPMRRIYNALSYDHFAITSSSGAGFYIVDVSDPANPVELGSNIPGGRQFQLVGQDLYVAQPETYSLDGLHRFDLSDPEYPERSGSLVLGHDSHNILVHNNMIYVIGWDHGVQSIPDDGIYHPNGISTILPGSHDDLTLMDDLGVLINFSGINIYDWSNPTAPIELSSWKPAYPPQEVILRDSLMFVVCGPEASIGDFPGSFEIYDIHDPVNPQLISSFISPSSPFYELELGDSVAFILDFFEGIRTFDISDPTSPEEMVLLEGNFEHLLVSDGYIYATSGREIHIFDIGSQIGQYELVGKYVHDASLQFMAKDSDTLFVTSGSDVIALQTVDPEELQIIGNYNLPGSIQALDHHGKNLYLTTYRKGIFVLSYDATLGIKPGENNSSIPQSHFIRGLFPNPFNSQITIQYEVLMEMDLSMIIYDLLGREIWTHKKTRQQIGKHTLQWNGKANDGSEVPSGVYIVRLSSSKSSESRKIVVLR